MAMKDIFALFADYFVGEIKNIITTAAIGATIGYAIFSNLSGDLLKVRGEMVTNNKVVNNLTEKIIKVEEKVVTNNNEIINYIVIPSTAAVETKVAGSKYFIAYVNNADLATKVGIELEEHQKTWAKAFYFALAECSKKQKAKIKIIGHASTAEFKINKKPLQNSENLNMRVANMRAAELGAFFESIDENSMVDINVVKYKSSKELKRPYFDKNTSSDSRAAEFLNRSISIEIIHAGGCEK